MKSLLMTLLLSAMAAHADSSDSIYNLEASLTDQSGVQHGLDVYRGHPAFVTMFYGSCPMACPLLIDTLRALERAAEPAQRADLRFLLISIDAEHDTVANLQALAVTRKLDPARWTLARTDAANVRKIAAVLGVQYRPLPSGGYNHSSIVTLLTASGDIHLQSSLLSQADPLLLTALRQITSSPAHAAR